MAYIIANGKAQIGIGHHAVFAERRLVQFKLRFDERNRPSLLWQRRGEHGQCFFLADETDIADQPVKRVRSKSAA